MRGAWKVRQDQHSRLNTAGHEPDYPTRGARGSREPLLRYPRWQMAHNVGGFAIHRGGPNRLVLRWKPTESRPEKSRCASFRRRHLFAYYGPLIRPAARSVALRAARPQLARQLGLSRLATDCCGNTSARH